MPARVTRRAKKPGTVQRGRPPVYADAWTKVSVVLFERQIHSLDLLRRQLARDAKRPISRAAVIRAAVDTLLDATGRRSRAELDALRRALAAAGAAGSDGD